MQTEFQKFIFEVIMLIKNLVIGCNKVDHFFVGIFQLSLWMQDWGLNLFSISIFILLPDWKYNVNERVTIGDKKKVNVSRSIWFQIAVILIQISFF